MTTATTTKRKRRPDGAAECRAAWPRLAAWWDAAKAHGTIYTRTDVGRSGMRATVLLWTITPPGRYTTATVGNLDVAWPDDDACAKVFGFSFARRAFVRGGCGFDRAHDVAQALAFVFDGTPSLAAAPRLETLNQPA